MATLDGNKLQLFDQCMVSGNLVIMLEGFYLEKTYIFNLQTKNAQFWPFAVYNLYLETFPSRCIYL